MDLVMLPKELLSFDEFKSIVQLFIYSLLSEINIFSLSFMASKNNQTDISIPYPKLSRSYHN